MSTEIGSNQERGQGIPARAIRCVKTTEDAGNPHPLGRTGATRCDTRRRGKPCKLRGLPFSVQYEGESAAERAPRKLRSVVRDDRLRQADVGTQPFEHADHTRTWQRPIDLDRETLPREVVDDIERPKGPSVGERVDHEVHRPALTGPARRRQRDALAAREPLAPTAADLQPGLAINRVDAFVIRDDAFATDQGMEPPVAEARALGGMCLEPRQQRAVVDTAPALVPPRGRAQANHATGASFTRAARLGKPPHHFALSDGAYHFFATTAFSAWMSSVCSATMCFNRRFSSSSCFSRCISLSSMPPYLAFQR